MRVLVNADWTAEMEKAPPMVTKTELRGRIIRTTESWRWKGKVKTYSLQ
jgi:hypothetical protein